MKQLIWIKNTEGHWLDLQTVNLLHPNLNSVSGVYIIWHRGNPSQVVRVGQGDIRERLLFQRQNPDVQAYSSYGLSVTWASVPAAEHNGVERYLSDLFQPKTGDRWPDVTPIPVNSPFQ